MKISKLLVLSALWLTATSVKAEVPDGIWTMPEPQGLEFTTFTNDPLSRYYLYNPGAKMFFASGNSWGTQASVRTFGYPFWVEPSTEENAPEGSYELFNDFYNPDDRADVTGRHNLFTDDGNSTWLDHASQPNYSWTFTIVGDCVRFQNVAFVTAKPEFEGTYIGWTGDYAGANNSSVLKHVSPDAEGACVDWKAVTEESYNAFVANEEAYNAYKDGVARYISAMKLKGVLNEASSLGANIEAQLAVYTNTNSTATELNDAATALTSNIDARKSLKKAIDVAKSKGFTGTAPYEAVLNDGNATVDELKKAQTDMETEMVEWAKNQATVDNPADMTAKIVNPKFDGDDRSTGWSTAFNAAGPKENAEYWNMGYDTHQTIKGLPEGVYALSAKAFYRAGSNTSSALSNWKANNADSKKAKLYATAGENTREVAIANVFSGAQLENPGVGAIVGVETTDENGEPVTLYVPNNMEAAEHYMHALDQYSNTLFLAVAEGEDLVIGVKKDGNIGDDWSMFDDFTLTFYGNAADAYQKYLDELLKDYTDVTAEEGTYTEEYLTKYMEFIDAPHTAASRAEVDAVVAEIKAVYDSLQTNIDLWKKYEAKTLEAESYAVDPKYQMLDAAGDLGDISMDSADILEAKELTNGELQDAIDYIDNLIAQVLDEYKNMLQPGEDVTHLLKNPGFDEDADINSGNAEGWTKDVIANPHNGNITRGPLGQDNKNLMEGALGTMNYCFEAWHVSKFDVWQEVKNAPVGVYEISVQGFLRCENSGYNKGDEIPQAPIYLYLNDAKSYLPSVYSEQRDGWDFTTVEGWTAETVNDYQYPNSMGGASQCFAHGMYKKSAYGLVAKKGDTMRIGVKGDVPGDDNWWCIWDNFKLTYQGFEPSVVAPALDEALATLDLSQPMGKSIFEKADALNNQATEAKAANDGEKMFAVLTDVYALSDEIIASVKLFATLNDAASGLRDYAGFGAVASATVKSEGEALANSILTGIEDRSIDDSEVEGLLQQISDMRTKLGIPADYAEATDNNPKDFTTIIVNPAFDENASNWLGTAAAVNNEYFNAEIFGKNFDFYQEYKGLPAGTYQLSVQAYFRAGSAADDYKYWKENPDSLNNAFLYAVNGDSTVFSSPIMRLATCAEVGEATSDNGMAWADQEAGLVVPNTMVTGGDKFLEGLFVDNKVIAKVGEDGFLRIGLKKNVEIENNWLLFDNFKLVYFGANSDQNASEDPSGIQDVNTDNGIRVEFFTLDGRKANAAQKGILVQKMTMGNGAVVVKKVRR